MRFPCLYLLLAGLLLASCGDGGSSTAGIEGTGSPVAASGTVTGFGSVYVNGQRFDDNQAQVLINGQPASTADLKPGMQVQLEARQQGANLRATRISYDRHAFGQLVAIEQVDAETLRLEILGQQLLAPSDAVFDGVDFASLAVGDWLEVSGLLQPAGEADSLLATRVVKREAAAQVDLEGSISQFNPLQQRFHIEALTVDYSQASFANGSAAALGNHIRIEVQGVLEGGLLVAQTISFKPAAPAPAAQTRVLYEGLVSEFVSLADFRLGDWRVNAQGANLALGQSGDIANGLRLALEGVMDASGVVQASKVYVQQPSQVKVRGQVEAIDLARNELSLMGQVYSATELTAFEDRSSLANRYISLAQLAVGDYVELFARAEGDDWLVLRIRRLNDGGMVQLSGPLNRIESSSLVVVMGVQVDISGLEDSAWILELNPGTRVSLSGVQTGPQSIKASTFVIAE